jgi:hypothetical protein
MRATKEAGKKGKKSKKVTVTPQEVLRELVQAVGEDSLSMGNRWNKHTLAE